MRVVSTVLPPLALLVAQLTGCSSSTADSGSDEGRSPAGGGHASSNSATNPAAGATSAAVGATSSAGGTRSGINNTQNAGGAEGVGGSAATVSTHAAIDCRKEGDAKTTLVFINGCAKPLTYRGSDISGGTLAPGAFACVDVGTATETLSSKRYWGWTGSDPGTGRYTLAEFTFNTDFHDLDWYDISHVDAHNVPMAILPAVRPKCRVLACPEDFLAACPTEGQFRDAQGTLVSCVSPNRDDPNNAVVQLFERCDDAYAWSGDDQKGEDESPMIGCEVEDFDIVFCPEAT